MAATRITVRVNGPILVEGDFEIVDANGTPYGLAGRTRVTLCRCGESETKPFCDGHHKVCGFESESVARDLPPPVPKPAAP
jgi:CDGSH-type Zn-finger protein